MKKMLVFGTVLFVTGCMQHNIKVYEKVDQTEKNVTVPAGAKGLKGELKKLLSDKGWKLFVYRGPFVTEGTVGAKTKLEKYNTFNTRYRLMVWTIPRSSGWS